MSVILIDGISTLTSPLFKKSQGGSVVTIGNFDGVHMGHKKLLGRVLEKSRATKAHSVVFTFDPHPVQVLFPERKLKRLFPREDQIEQMESLGVEALVMEPFSRVLSQTSPEDFLKKYIIEPLNPVALVVGYDFSFGANRKGGISDLENFSTKNGLELEVVPALEFEGQAVSSTRIRTAVIDGKMPLARELLGRPFYVRGLVEKGAQRGRKIGFPTANLTIREECLPAKGVYATWTWVRGKRWMSATNIGVNPTFLDDGPICVETHILDFDDSIYGEEIRVEFASRLRDEIKFSGVDGLKKQLHLDIQDAKRILNGTS